MEVEAPAPKSNAFRWATLFRFNTRKKISARRASEVHHARILFGLMSVDTAELIQSTCVSLYQLFSVVLASLLSIFVPQKCPADPEHGFDTDHSCTEKENMGLVSPLTQFETAVLVWNYITLGFAIVHYFIVYQREKFLIRSFDMNPKLAVENLPEIIHQYPEVKSDLWKWNVIMFASSVWIITLFLINTIMSGVMIFGTYYDNFRTSTFFVANMLLMAGLLYTTLFHAWIGFQRNLAYSCFEFAALSFNVIDPKYLAAIEEEQPASDSTASSDAVQRQLKQMSAAV